MDVNMESASRFNETKFADIQFNLGQEGAEKDIILVAWLKGVGDSVLAGESIAEVETDKVALEIASPKSGVFYEALTKAGDAVTQGQVMGRIEYESDALASNNMDVEARALDFTTMHDETDVLYEPIIGAKIFENLGNKAKQLIDHYVSINDGEIETKKQEQTNVITLNPDGSSDDPGEISKHGIEAGKLISLSATQRSTAKHMVDSLLRTAPHVTSVFEMDLSRIIDHKLSCAAIHEKSGIHITFTSYFVTAAAKALQIVPEVNSRFESGGIRLLADINIGIAVAVDGNNLVVPVLHQTQNLSWLEISKRLDDMTKRTRDGKLNVADVRHGTFTISNHGVSGSLLATPIIINQPQSAILGIGKVQKRPVVESINGEDIISIKPMSYVTLTIDHRSLNASQTNQFLTEFVKTIEHWSCSE